MHWNEVVDHGDAALLGALWSRHVNEHLMVILIITMKMISLGLMRLVIADVNHEGNDIDDGN